MRKRFMHVLVTAALAAAFGPQVTGAASGKEAGLTAGQVNGVKVGMAYKEARQRLFEFGYSGVAPPKVAGRCAYREDICKAYPEAEDCAGTGLAPCRFVFKYPRGRTVVIITSGEELADLAVRSIFQLN
jgi:hypothetical protein